MIRCFSKKNQREFFKTERISWKDYSHARVISRKKRYNKNVKNTLLRKHHYSRKG